MKKYLLAITAFLVTSQVSEASPKILFSDRVQDKDVAQQIIFTLLVSCPRLAGAMSDLEEIKVDFQTEYAEHRLGLGWKDNYHIAIKIVDDTKILPAFNDEVDFIQGVTAHYDVGAGHMPGIYGSKRVSQWLCDIPVVDGHDSFRTDPKFSFIEY